MRNIIHLKICAAILSAAMASLLHTNAADPGTLTTADVGAPSPAGSIAPTGNGIDVTVGGTDIGGTADQFSFSYESLTGDFDVQVRVSGLTLADTWTKAGLMARETLTANSRYAAALSTPSGIGAFFSARSVTGAAATSSGNFPVNYPNMWLRLSRVGNVFTGYAGVDGQSWAQIGAVSNAMPATVFIGVAASSHVTGQSTTAQFRDYSTVTNASTTPVALNIEPPGPSRRTTCFVITEIMHNPAPREDTNSLEFVEIYNSNPFPEEIGGYRLSEEIDYTFPEGMHIPGGAFIVVAKNPAAFQAAYAISGVMGPFTNSLARSGTLQLRNKENAVLLEVPYSSDNPWPIGAEDTGHSLVLNRPSYGEGSPQAWSISAAIGGSPGQWEHARAGGLHNVMINEILVHTDPPLLDFIELYNHGNQPVDISGFFLSDTATTNSFIVPSNTVIAARGFKVFDQNALGFGLSSGGETIYFRGSDQVVLDAVQFEAQGNGVSYGRHPDGAPAYYPLAALTPGTNNSNVLIHDIVINEIMYRPVSGNSDDEYVELYNQGTNPVDLAGWRFVSGIDYTFPSNTVLQAGQYLVVARNLTNLLAHYGNLTTLNTFGDYDGSLANSGERLALAMPDLNVSTNNQGQVSTNTVYVVVDEVTYVNGGNWGKWANEGGSSLELIDPRSNHRLAHNWADSDETTKAPWITVTATGAMEQGMGAANLIELLSLGEGEYLVDNVEVLNNSQANMVAPTNSTLDTGIGGWRVRGTHIRSQWVPDQGVDNTGCLHVRASARGDTMGNRAVCPITTPSGVVTLRAQVRWLKGWPEFLLRLHGNHMEAFGRLPLPATAGTPGGRNSQAVTNASPAIYQVTHTPVLPAANQPAVVTARVHDPDGISSLILNYRIDPASGYTPVPMVDNGTSGDAIANDGLFSGTIPPQPANTLVAFQVTATDSHGATRLFPLQFPGYALPFECLVRFGDPILASAFGTYRQWYTANAVNTWINRPALSNEKIYGTFVYGNVRVIYNISAKYSSSPYHQGQHTSPVTGSVHYTMDLPLDDQCLGTDNWNKVHAPGNSAFDENTNQREQIGYWFARQMGLPWNYRRFVHMIVNGVKKGTAAQIMEDTERGGDDFVDTRFPDDRDGHLYKMQPWFEVDDGNSLTLGFQNQNWCTLNRYSPGTNSAVHLPPRYRQNWLVRAADVTANDFSPVYALVDAANTPTNGWSAHASAMESTADMEEWMRIFAVCHAVGDWDHFGTQNAQNMYGYKPRNGKWTLMIWDFNILMGNSGSWAPGQNLFTINASDSRMPWLYANPQFRRMYLRGLKEMAAGHMQANRVEPVIDARQAALTASGVNVPAANVTALKNWIRDARNSITNTVRAEDATEFRLTSASEVTTSNNLVVITGEAPVEIAFIRINGVDYPVTWNTVRAWLVRVAVSDPNTILNIEGYNLRGDRVGNSQVVTVTYEGPAPVAEGALVINEIMYHPARPDASFVEIYNRSPDFSFDLLGWRVNGIDFTFQSGVVISNGQYLVLAKDGGAFSAAYGSAPITGLFEGNLDQGGETISLERPLSVVATNGANVTTNTVYVAVDKVKYDDDLPWTPSADGAGPSLQLIDANQDNSRVSNWDGGIGWTHVSRTGNIANATNLLLWLPAANASVYVDDISLVGPEGTNIIQNPSFESGDTAPWIIPAIYSNSEVVTNESHSGIHSLLIRGTTAGGGFNTIQQWFRGRVTTNSIYTLSFWCRPVTSAFQVQARTLPGNNLSTNGIAQVLVGTPGAFNAFASTLPAYDPVWLNEVQVNNQSGITDNAGERESWIELYNAGSTTIDLSGYYLADSYTNGLLQWQFPAEAALEPGRFKIVWVDGEQAEATANDWHTSFRLANPTGSVALVRMADGKPQITDYLNYSGLGPNLSYGSAPDGQPFNRVAMFTPTPGTTNVARNANVFINEWMADNTAFIADPADGDTNDWFELYNAGSEAVDLGNYYLTDNLSNRRQYQIPNNGRYVLPPGGFLLVWADNETGQNAANQTDLHANFQLSRSGESIGLFAPDGVTAIDTVTFGVQTNDVSEGRYADGATSRYFMTMPTPRLPNVLGNGQNTPPSLAPIPNRIVTLGQDLGFTVTATDPDLPAQTLSFSLDPGYPDGASITGNGAFSWTPTPAQTPSSNNIVVRVTDDGVPPASTTRAFVVQVVPPPRTAIAVNQGGAVSLSFETIAGRTYRVEYKNDLNDEEWVSLGDDVVAASGSLTIPDTIGANSQRFYRIVQVD